MCLTEQKPGDGPQLTALETAAPFPHNPLWRSAFLKATQELCGQRQHPVRAGCSFAVPSCPFLTGSWIPIAAHGDKVAPTYAYGHHAEDRPPW